MKQLERIVLIQFFMFDAEEIAIRGNTAWLGPNGAGKTSVLDSIQIALLGAHQGYLKFNTQSVSTSQKKNYRSIRDYCLGVIQGGDVPNAATDRRRDVADTYISLVFRDQNTGEPVSVGVALHAQQDLAEHIVKGLYVLPGVELTLTDHTETLNGEIMPLHWKDFEHVLRTKSAAAARTLEITDKPESYIREMLHALQPRAKRIDPRAFMKSFKKSVTLRDIESVNDFVRDFLVDAHPIDKHRAIVQIEEFRKLDRMVKQTQEQIRDLVAFNKRYERLASEYRDVATMDYLVAFYEHEELTNKAGSIEDTIEVEKEAAKKSDLESSRLEKIAGELRESIQKLEADLQSDPTAGRVSDIEAELKEASRSSSPHYQALQGLRLDFATALNRMTVIPGFTGARPEVEGMAIRLAELAKDAEPNSDKAREILVGALELVTANRSWIEREYPDAKQILDESEHRLQKLLAAYKAMEQHGVRLSDNTAAAIALLAEHGIHATPVCSLVHVTKQEWQSAIEAYLGRNRESLIITGKRERDAVRVIRELPEKSRLYDVTIVQPQHLHHSEWSDPDNVLVGSLIDGEDGVAISYLRMLLGKTRMVITEEELERFPRSLTQDGMLSANGGTRTIRLVPPDQFMIGTKATDSSRNALVVDIQNATRDHQDANTYFKAVDGAKNAIDQLGATPRLLDVIASSCDELARLSTKIADLTLQKGALKEDSRIISLREAIEAKKKNLQTQDNAYKDALADAVSHRTRAEEKQKDLDELQPRLELSRTHVGEASQHPDYAQFIVQRVVEEHESRGNFPYHLRKADCIERRSKAQSRANHQIQMLVPDFDRYLAAASITLLDERTDWRKARDWVAAEHERLEGTQLARYQEEVENAKRIGLHPFQ